MIFAGQRVVVVGRAISQSPELQSALHDAGYDLEVVDPTVPGVLDTAADTRLVIIASDCPLHPDWRGAVTRFLNAGGNAIVVGPQNFDYAPRPVRPVPVQQFTDPASYDVISSQIMTASAEPPRVELAAGPEGTQALRLRTYLRGMGKTMVTFSAVQPRSAERTLLTFQARGNAYADLLTVEITDIHRHRWMHFAPLSPQWQQHTISLADFIPEKWSDADKPYPLLSPAEIQTIAMGIDPKTVWNEKPMDLSLASVELAEDEGLHYTPSASLRSLRIPFLESGIATPDWLFDPFPANVQANGQACLVSMAREDVLKPVTVVTSKSWLCPPPFVEHPGTKMGTDTSPVKSYNMGAVRRMRRIPIWTAGKEPSTRCQTVAELRISGSGPQAGSAVALFGVMPNDLVMHAPLRESLVRTVADILGKPKIVDAVLHTTPPRTDQPVSPSMRVVVQNPHQEPISAQVTVDLANGKVRGEAPVTIPPHATASVTVILDAVPADFPFSRFDWRINLKNARGNDLFGGTTDVERGLIVAVKHMVRAQSFFPDGRISHHYFGDAYGVRAMVAYLDLLKREPKRVENYPDLWSEVTPDDMRQCAERWIEMMLSRQNEDGSYPMGYGEHTASSNVADGGQIALGIGQITRYLDGEQHEACLQFCRRFADWAETFYIDEKESMKLSAEHSGKFKQEDLRAGHYALGTYSLGRRHIGGPKWVMQDLLGVQMLLSREDPNPEYRRVAERNVRFHLDSGYGAAGYYQAEGLVWSWLALDDAELRERIQRNLRDTFLKARLEDKEGDMYAAGSRGTLRGLSVQYYRRLFDDSEIARALQLKYVWAFASEDLSDSMSRLSEAHSKPHHGASIAAVKFAELSAIWAIELLDPGSTLLPSDSADSYLSTKQW